MPPLVSRLPHLEMVSRRVGDQHTSVGSGKTSGEDLRGEPLVIFAYLASVVWKLCYHRTFLFRLSSKMLFAKIVSTFCFRSHSGWKGQGIDSSWLLALNLLGFSPIHPYNKLPLLIKLNIGQHICTTSISPALTKNFMMSREREKYWPDKGKACNLYTKQPFKSSP